MVKDGHEAYFPAREVRCAGESVATLGKRAGQESSGLDVLGLGAMTVLPGSERPDGVPKVNRGYAEGRRVPPAVRLAAACATGLQSCAVQEPDHLGHLDAQTKFISVDACSQPVAGLQPRVNQRRLCEKGFRNRQLCADAGNL